MGEFIDRFEGGEFISLDDFFDDYEKNKQELCELKERVRKLEDLMQFQTK